MKLELISALAVAATLALLAVYTNLPRISENQGYLYTLSRNGLESTQALQGTSGMVTQQFISENIQGELRKGEFETTVQGVRNLTSSYGGRVPVLHMSFENEMWSGTLICEVPTDNVTSFTFGARKLVKDHGKVTHISIDVTETEVNQTQTQGIPVSEINMYLYERAEGTSPLVDQIGAVVPLLTTGLVWIAEGLIVGVPLCFVSLGVVLFVDRGIVPVWKKQFRNRGLVEKRTENITAKSN